jgi:hypothetical protein
VVPDWPIEPDPNALKRSLSKPRTKPRIKPRTKPRAKRRTKHRARAPLRKRADDDGSGGDDGSSGDDDDSAMPPLRQKDASIDLVMISQPPGVELIGLTDYVFDEAAGESVTVYIVDSGLNPNHEVSTPLMRILSRLILR